MLSRLLGRFEVCDVFFAERIDGTFSSLKGGPSLAKLVLSLLLDDFHAECFFLDFRGPIFSHFLVLLSVNLVDLYLFFLLLSLLSVLLELRPKISKRDL